MEKVIIALSGGIDSSVCAYLLKQMGFEIEAVFFLLFDDSPTYELAKKSSDFLGIKLHVEDLRDKFKSEVIEPFFDGYRKGITPNPCVVCNKRIKFPVLKQISDRRGAKFFSTGHYARVKRKNDAAFLLRGVDIKKDQSYFLYGINRDYLSQLILPLGDYRKTQIREIAHNINIPSKVAEESSDICFLKEKRYYEMIRPLRHGPIIEMSTGKILGQHRGIHLFTIGQRRRIGISSSYPLYVVKIDPLNNAVYVDSREKAFHKEIIVEELNWLYEIRGEQISCSVKIRYAMNPESAILKIIDKNTVKVCFERAQFAPTPGQSAVFYMDETVLGGGVIKESGQANGVTLSHQAQT